MTTINETSWCTLHSCMICILTVVQIFWPPIAAQRLSCRRGEPLPFCVWPLLRSGACNDPVTTCMGLVCWFTSSGGYNGNGGHSYGVDIDSNFEKLVIRWHEYQLWTAEQHCRRIIGMDFSLVFEWMINGCSYWLNRCHSRSLEQCKKHML